MWSNISDDIYTAANVKTRCECVRTMVKCVDVCADALLQDVFNRIFKPITQNNIHCTVTSAHGQPKHTHTLRTIRMYPEYYLMSTKINNGFWHSIWIDTCQSIRIESKQNDQLLISKMRIKSSIFWWKIKTNSSFSNQWHVFKSIDNTVERSECQKKNKPQIVYNISNAHRQRQPLNRSLVPTHAPILVHLLIVHLCTQSR